MDMNKATAQSKEASEQMSFAAAGAANLIQSSCTTALEGVQAYNEKLVEFMRLNTAAAFDFVQKLGGIKSPSEFIEISTGHARAQTEALSGQTEQLAALARKIALASTGPLMSGAAKAPSHTA
jgi:hypothetical protein